MESLCGRNMLRLLESRVTVILKIYCEQGFACFYSVSWESSKSFRQRMDISDLHYKRTIWYRGVHCRMDKAEAEDKTGDFHNNLGKGSS